MSSSDPSPPPAFDELFALHEAAFRAYARSVLPTWDAVDEVIRSASLIMWKKLGEVDLPEGFLPRGKLVVCFVAQKYCRTREQIALEQCLREVSEASSRHRKNAIIECPVAHHPGLGRLRQKFADRTGVLAEI